MKQIFLKSISEFAVCGLVFSAGYGCLLLTGYELLGGALALVGMIGGALVLFNTLRRIFKRLGDSEQDSLAHEEGGGG